MNHDDIRHKLSEYIDNALSAEERAAVESHLKTCAICDNALEELRKAVEQVKQVEELEPPAWMTQKIMAKVRAEAEAKKPWHQRLFFPLATKLPIQAVALLFLAVTAYYIHQNIPAERYKEAPLETFEAAKPAAPAFAPAPEPEIKREPAAPAKKVRQAPQYKALDMKQEYERPAQPLSAGGAGAHAPATSETPAMAKKEAAFEKQIFASRAAALAMMRERAADETAKDKGAELSPIVNPTASLDFRNFPSGDIYRGEPASVDLASHPKAPMWRSMLMKAAEKGPNFAGHYTIAIWGCGTSCQAFAIIDAITGKVYFPSNLSQVSWAGWWKKDYGLKFRIDSDLLIVYGSPNEGTERGIFYYRWRNNALQLIDRKLKEK